MKLIAREQINLVLASPIVGLSLSAVGTSTDVSTPIATMLNTAGRNGVSVPVAVSTTPDIVGLICTGVNNRVVIRSGTNKGPIRSGSEEVYARLTNAGAVYTLSYFYNAVGTETAYTFGATTTIDFIIPYRFDLYRLPPDALITAGATILTQDIAGSGGTPPLLFAEALTITTINTLPSLSKTPINGNFVHLTINGAVYYPITPAPAFSVSAKALTWIPANGFTLVVGSDVVATYSTIE